MLSEVDFLSISGIISLVVVVRIFFSPEIVKLKCMKK